MEFDEKMTIPRNDGHKVIECTSDECDLDYFIYDDPKYTVDQILSIYGQA